MSWEKFTDFLKGFARAHQLMNRAEVMVVLWSMFALLHQLLMGLLGFSYFKTSVRYESCNIPTELIYQSEQCKIITERAIYKSALEKNILTNEQFNSLETLYERRNKVIHRYIISEITTDQFCK